MSRIQLQNIKTGAFALIDSLVRNGTKHIFGYPGGAILPIYDELYFWEKQNLIQHILTRHEQGAVHAADSYARVTGQIGVCFATSGPGATNLVTGIANAQMDSIPILIITGQVNSNFLGTDAFQETDIFGITLPIVKHSYRVSNPKDIPNIISEAYYLAQNGRPGPILIDIPKDVGAKKFIEYYPNQQRDILKLQGHRFRYRMNRTSLIKTVDSLREAAKPILYVGGGALISHAYKELMELAKTFLIPVTTTLMGKGIFDEKNSLSLGMLGMHGTAYANFAISECDLLIAAGARFDDRVTGKLDSFACLAKIIHIDIDPAEMGKNKIVDISLIGEVKTIFQEILITHKLDSSKYIVPIKRLNWLDIITEWRITYPLIIPKVKDKLSPQQVICSIGKKYPSAIFTTDVGQHQMWSAQFIKCSPRRWSTSAGLGTMGYGLPAAIGAQIAFPKEYVICITGDSSFQMCLQELGTISQYNLPIRIIIINNHWQGMVRQWQESFYDNRYSHSNMNQGQPNFVALANSYGIKGVNIGNETELKEVLDSYQSYPAAILFDCLVVENENCYPMVSPGGTNAAMTGIKYKNDEIALLKRHTCENDDVETFFGKL